MATTAPAAPTTATKAAAPEATPSAQTAADTAEAKDPEPETAKPKASSEPIPSTCIKKFYSKDMQLVTEGTPFVFTREDDEPYPWPLLRPNDTSLEKELRKEYLDYKKDKEKNLKNRTSLSSALRNALSDEE